MNSMSAANLEMWSRSVRQGVLKFISVINIASLDAVRLLLHLRPQHPSSPSHLRIPHREGLRPDRRSSLAFDTREETSG